MKIALEFKSDKQLEKNDILVFQNGQWTNVRKAEFLLFINKELAKLNEGLNEQKVSLDMAHNRASALEIHNKNRLLVWAKSIYDNFVDRGLLEDNEDFQTMWYNFYFNDGVLNIEEAPEEYKQILNKVESL